MLDKLAIDELLRSKFTGEHILGILPEERMTTMHNYNLTAMKAQINMAANAVISKPCSEKLIDNTFHKTGKDTRKENYSPILHKLPSN